jgi:hypothetical protein
MPSRIHWGLHVYFVRDKTILFIAVCHVVRYVKNKASVWGFDMLPAVGTVKLVLQTVG